MPASMTETSVEPVAKTLVHTQPQSAVRIEKNTEPVPRATVVIDDKSIEEILKENYGVGAGGDDAVKVVNRKEDLTKTKIF